MFQRRSLRPAFDHYSCYICMSRWTQVQHRGSPLSAVLACLFMETLERDHCKDIIGRHSTWLHYVDDVLIIVPRRLCLHHMLTRLNSVHEKTQFTVEEEVDQKLPFLDTLIHPDYDGLHFSEEGGEHTCKINPSDIL
ncbi:uncharacterized protein [Penaeus vannamei]|uniref:uncharacterized protein n=1 Tax=Penaeus vannamei TaxID=6689 RepID=UPI00387F9F1B